ncbi:MAG: glycyl-radical enzyme activating protein [Candidatus Latescibacterota bacterium]|jgi:pyruvate formate lyase activating enzyme
MPERAGRVFEIQRFSIHDGPGIRTTVFLQGCPLHCLWCHNPEGRAAGPLLSYQAAQCVACGECVRACPRHSHLMLDGRHAFDRRVCAACGRCAGVCPSGALELIGRQVTVEEVLAECLPDLPFYRNSGGGITLSGGEPLCQLEFAEALMTAARAAGLHCAVETSGAVPFAHLERVLPLVDLFLYDLKETDEARHREFTGASNRGIIDNLCQLCRRGARVRLRLPLIPGLNDRPDHFAAVAALVASLPPFDRNGVELMPYHRLGLAKRERLGLDGDSPLEIEPPSSATVDGWIDALADLGVTVLNRAASAAVSWRKRVTDVRLR